MSAGLRLYTFTMPVPMRIRDVRAAIALQPGWLELLPRIPQAFAPAAPAVLARLREQA